MSHVEKTGLDDIAEYCDDKITGQESRWSDISAVFKEGKRANEDSGDQRKQLFCKHVPRGGILNAINETDKL